MTSAPVLLLTVQEAAPMLNLHATTLRRMCADGRLLEQLGIEPIRLGRASRGNTWRIPHAAIIARLDPNHTITKAPS